MQRIRSTRSEWLRETSIRSNTSYRIIKQLPEVYQGSAHVTSENLTNATDNEIWAYAKKNDFIIVTFDADFADISTVKGYPPKVI